MKKQVNKILCCLLLVFSCLLSVLINTNIQSVFAVSNATEYTSVLTDLKTDENFKMSDYVVNKNDYSLQVIQIAESVNDELFVYVYQPCSPNTDLQATNIRMSKSIDADLHYLEYKLKLVSFSGVFYKYKVDNFTLETTETRYYDISEILRKWHSDYDEPTGNNNTISEVAFEVGKRFVARTTDGNVSYNCFETETVDITAKFIDSLRYWNGYYLFAYEMVDRHFVAFSTNYDIDRLYEVDLIFTTRDYQATNVNVLPIDYLSWEVTRTYESEVPHEVTLYAKKGLEVYGIGGCSYSWNEIQTTSDFLTENNNALSETTKNNVRDKQFVLTYYGTYWAQTTTLGVSGVAGTEVYDVSLLRLKFSSNGVVYNLGVIDNKQSGDNIPSNYGNYLSYFSSSKQNNWLEKIIAFIMLALALIILAPILPYIFKFIFWLVKGIWQVITAPLKAIKMSKKKRKKGGGKI